MRSFPWIIFLTILLACAVDGKGPSSSAQEPESFRSNNEIEFSARLIWRSGGKTSKAQLFVKGDRYRIEHMAGVRTDLGYAGVTIIRLDKQKVWYVLSRRRLVMAVPLTVDYLLPFSVRLDGETARTLIGDAFASGRPAKLFEVVVERSGRRETFFEWVDTERDVLLKLVSQDRDWAVEYEHIVYSTQPEFYFEPPLGYQRIEATEKQAEAG
jgi:hypothetical protein